MPEAPDNLPTFRSEVRSWIARELPADWRAGLADGSEGDVVAFQRWWMGRLAEAGFAAPTLPKAFGGGGLDFEHRLIIADELARADTPPLDVFMVTLNHTPATLLEWGSPEQKARYLPSVARGDVWCQGFSEPNAGSDLASLRTSAVRNGDGYVVNGQKIWSSFSRYAKYCLLLARTDPGSAKREGISYFILDMDSPGIEVRPIRQATDNSDFSELFFTDVVVPHDNLIGPENDGWRVAQSTLSAERGVLAFERIERLWYHLQRFLAAANEGQAPWLPDPQMRRQFATLYSELQAERRLVQKLLRSGPEDAGAAALPAIIKLSSTDLAQRLADFLLGASDMSGQFYRRSFECNFREPMFDYIHTFGETISAGSNEIMRNLIAERILGLPR